MRRVSSSYWCAVRTGEGIWSGSYIRAVSDRERFHASDIVAQALTRFDGNVRLDRIGDEAGFVRQVMDLRQSFGIGAAGDFRTQDHFGDPELSATSLRRVIFQKAYGIIL